MPNIEPAVSLGAGRGARRLARTDLERGLLVVGAGTPGADCAYERLAGDLFAAAGSGPSPLSVLLLGPHAALRRAAARTASAAVLPDYYDLRFDPDGGWLWNPLHAPWLTARELATLLVDLVPGVVRPLSVQERRAAVSLLSVLFASWRAHPHPWFTFRDLHATVFDTQAVAAVLDRSADHVWSTYSYEVHILAEGFAELPDVLREVELTRADVERSRAAGHHRPLTCSLLPGGADSCTYTFDWQRRGDRYIAVVDGNSYVVLAWVLRGACAAVRGFDGAPVVPAVPFGGLQLARPSDQVLGSVHRCFRWFEDEWVGGPRALRNAVLGVLSDLFSPLCDAPCGDLLSPDAPSDLDPCERARLVPSLDVLAARGRAFVVAGFDGLAAPPVARALHVLAKRLWLSAAEARAPDSASASRPPAVLYAPRYERAVLDADDFAADVEVFSDARRLGVVPVVCVRSPDALDALAGTDWTGRLVGVLGVRAVVSALGGGLARRLAAALLPAAPADRVAACAARIGRLGDFAGLAVVRRARGGDALSRVTLPPYAGPAAPGALRSCLRWVRSAAAAAWARLRRTRCVAS